MPRQPRRRCYWPELSPDLDLETADELLTRAAFSPQGVRKKFSHAQRLPTMEFTSAQVSALRPATSNDYRQAGPIPGLQTGPSATGL